MCGSTPELQYYTTPYTHYSHPLLQNLTTLSDVRSGLATLLCLTLRLVSSWREGEILAGAGVAVAVASYVVGRLDSKYLCRVFLRLAPSTGMTFQWWCINFSLFLVCLQRLAFLHRVGLQ